MKPATTDPLLFRLLYALPFIVPAAVAAFGTVAVILLLIQRFDTFLVWIFGSVASLLVAIFIVQATTQHTTKRTRIWDLVALIAVILWVGINVLHTAQPVIGGRDDGTYAITAAHLGQHESLEMSIALEVIENAHLEPTSAGFSTNTEGTQLFAQGLHFFPALLGAIGKIVGTSHMLHFGPLFGGVALLAFYCFARMLVARRWAFVAMVALGACLPFIFFSRGVYTEPLTAALIFGGLGTLWQAHTSQRKLLWVLGGFTLGASVLVRIDALLIVAAFIAFSAAYVTYGRAQLRTPLLAMVPIAGLVGLALLDLYSLSRPYFAHHKMEIGSELALIAVIVLLGACLFFLSKRGVFQKKGVKNALRFVVKPEVIFVVVALVSIGIASRPLWLESHSRQQNPVVAEIQQATNTPVSTRNYAEFSGEWIAWYIGTVTVILGIVGLSFLIMRATRERRQSILLLFLLIFCALTLLYLIRPSVTADHIWASRRFLPVVIPGFILLATVSLQAAEPFVRRHVVNLRYAPYVLGAAILIIAPLMVSRPFLTLRDTTALPIVEQICQHTPEDTVVVWIGKAGAELTQTTLTFCHGIAATMSPEDAVDRTVLSTTAKQLHAEGKKMYLGAYATDMQQLSQHHGELGMTQIVNDSYEKLQPTLMSAPYERMGVTVDLYMGAVDLDGYINPL